jgi:molybdopterin molybdotransferase
MRSVAEAQSLILGLSQPLPPVAISLHPAPLDRLLAEEIRAQQDLPARDRSAMDGYAVRSADLPTGKGELLVIEEVTAGRVPQLALASGQACRIMTGAPVPAGADAVVVVERTRENVPGRVSIDDQPPRPGQNIVTRGKEMRAGEVVLPRGAILRPQEIGLLATLGCRTIQVHPAPTTAILSTGDELVEANEVPGPGQIRNSNGPMLTAQVTRAGGLAHYLGIARDSFEELGGKITDGLKADVFIVSGGVSAGKVDRVPEALQQAGVVAHIHKVAMKPGKPVLFGTFARPGGGGTLVFGLPGNPVSSLVCFELFARPVLRRLAGHPLPCPVGIQASLTEDFQYATDRPTYHPCLLESSGEGWKARPIPWFGSSDLRAFCQANALILFPVGSQKHCAGQRFFVQSMDG